MKKRIPVIALLLALVLFVFSGCDLLAVYTSDEKFPSDVATERGWEGSASSWLASREPSSTETRRVYEEAVRDGSFTGTYFEFLQATGIVDESMAVQNAVRSSVCISARIEKTGGNYASLGSGIIWSLDTATGDALIVTNYHVVCTSDGLSKDIRLYLYGETISSRAIPATFVGGVMQEDVAVLKVSGAAAFKASEGEVFAKEAVIADSDGVTVGERVYGVGNADGLGMSATEGVISMDAENIRIGTADGKSTIDSLLVMRTDAALNHGNSGGGLFNASGEVVGIVNARSEEDDVVGVAYALPANRVFAIAQNVMDNIGIEAVNRGAAIAYLGITTTVRDSHAMYDPTTGKIYLEEKIVVVSVIRGSKAEKMGFAAADTIVEAVLKSERGGTAVETRVAVTRDYKLSNLLPEVRLGDTLEIVVSRAGKTVTLSTVYSDPSDFQIFN